MVRHYKKLHFLQRFDLTQIIGTVIGATFVLYMGFSIITPTTEHIQTVRQPQGDKAARLSRTYYQSTPLLRVEIKGKYRWKTIFIEPSSGKAPADAWSLKEPKLSWDISGDYLQLSLNSSNVWRSAKL